MTTSTAMRFPTARESAVTILQGDSVQKITVSNCVTNTSGGSWGQFASACNCNTTWMLVGTPPPCPVHSGYNSQPIAPWYGGVQPLPPTITAPAPMTGVPPMTTQQIQDILNDLQLAPDPVDQMSDEEILAELREMIEELA